MKLQQGKMVTEECQDLKTKFQDMENRLIVKNQTINFKYLKSGATVKFQMQNI